MIAFLRRIFGYRKTAAAIGGAGTLAATVAFVGPWEGLRTEAYLDRIASPPVWTVCHGETRGVGPGDSYTKAECDAMLERRLVEFRAGLDRCTRRPFEDLPQGIQVALTSWAYNVGLGAACRSTLVRKLEAGDLRGACEELPRWNRAGGAVVRGLSNRRGAERALCLGALP